MTLRRMFPHSRASAFSPRRAPRALLTALAGACLVVLAALAGAGGVLIGGGAPPAAAARTPRGPDLRVATGAARCMNSKDSKMYQ